MFLDRREATHLLFIDSDVSAEGDLAIRAIRGMIAADRDIVCAPYPMKRIRWDQVEAAVKSGQPAAASAVVFPFLPMQRDALHVDAHGCVECEWVPAGFTMISRRCAEALRDRYRDELSFDDVLEDGRVIATVALFQLALTAYPDGKPGRILRSEDYSLCWRWREMGGKVHAYLGDGSPMDHTGEYLFRGAR
jgi:hypothetical protein